MLGRFIEFSLTARPIAPALELYRRLGFEELPSGDLLETPYVAVWDGSATLGLHDGALEGPTLTFVRPALADHVRGLRHLGIELEYQHLGDDEFNEAAFLDPDDQRVVLLEARTYSPGIWPPERIAPCGKLVEYSLATRSLEESVAFWETLGFARVASSDTPHPWVRLAGHGLTLGLHQTTAFRTALTYAADALEARFEYLQAKGLDVAYGTPLAARKRDSAVLAGPCGLPMFLVETPPR